MSCRGIVAEPGYTKPHQPLLAGLDSMAQPYSTNSTGLTSVPPEEIDSRLSVGLEIR